MTIWIDADACPRIIKEIVFRASARLQAPVVLVANVPLEKHHTPLVSSVVVPEGPDVADRYIAEHAAPTDLVITADIPLAARVVEKGGVALDPRGELYTEENVADRLSFRDLMQDLRLSGLVQGGPAQLGMADRQRFASALDRTLTRLARGRRHQI
ncbi:MAG TPA: YaiI/YqxD family protein [Verrucomicrobiae bacterium]|nr:YaiI/YqxD family protein [Verrucomicrobiae bacterium]